MKPDTFFETFARAEKKLKRIFPNIIIEGYSGRTYMYFSVPDKTADEIKDMCNQNKIPCLK